MLTWLKDKIEKKEESEDDESRSKSLNRTLSITDEKVKITKKNTSMR